MEKCVEVLGTLMIIFFYYCALMALLKCSKDPSTVYNRYKTFSNWNIKQTKMAAAAR